PITPRGRRPGEGWRRGRHAIIPVRATTRRAGWGRHRGMTLQRLKWLTLLAPLAFLAALEVAQQLIAPAFFRAWPGYLLLAGVALLATLAFNEAIFRVIDRLQARQVRQNRELLALHEAGLAIAEDLDLETVL